VKAIGKEGLKTQNGRQPDNGDQVP
jgi:hypothetical protein